MVARCGDTLPVPSSGKTVETKLHRIAGRARKEYYCGDVLSSCQEKQLSASIGWSNVHLVLLLRERPCGEPCA